MGADPTMGGRLKAQPWGWSHAWRAVGRERSRCTGRFHIPRSFDLVREEFLQPRPARRVTSERHEVRLGVRGHIQRRRFDLGNVRFRTIDLGHIHFQRVVGLGYVRWRSVGLALDGRRHHIGR